MGEERAPVLGGGGGEGGEAGVEARDEASHEGLHERRLLLEMDRGVGMETGMGGAGAATSGGK